MHSYLYTTCSMQDPGNTTEIFICCARTFPTKDLWHFDRVSAYFSDASQNFPVHKIWLISFWIGRLMY